MGKDHDTEILQRYSFTLPPTLIDNVDKMVDKLDINRSMAVREALSHWIDHRTKTTELEGEGVSVISYIYDHHETRVVNDLMETQHDYEDTIMTTSHIHLSHSKCFEIIICKDEIAEIKRLANALRSVKGISSFNTSYARD